MRRVTKPAGFTTRFGLRTAITMTTAVALSGIAYVALPTETGPNRSLGSGIAPAYGVAAERQKLAGPWKIAQVIGGVSAEAMAFAPQGAGWVSGYEVRDEQVNEVLYGRTGYGWERTTPPPEGIRGLLAAGSTTNVWAIGNGKAARWDGANWTTQPAVGDYTADAATAGGTNVWVVSESMVKSAARWSGQDWEEVTLPNYAQSVDALSADDVWLGGSTGTQAAVTRWDGSSLRSTELTAELRAGETGQITDIDAVSATDVWAVGHAYRWSCEDGEQGCFRPLLAHFDGQRWTVNVDEQGVDRGFDRVASDGVGGIWVATGDNSMVHVSAAGARTTHALPRPANSTISRITGLTRQGRTVWALAQSESTETGQQGVIYRADVPRR